MGQVPRGVGWQECCGVHREEPNRVNTPMLAAPALRGPRPWTTATRNRGPLRRPPSPTAPAWLLQTQPLQREHPTPLPPGARATCQGHWEARAHFPHEGAEEEKVRPLEPPRSDRTSRTVVLSAALLSSQSGLPPPRQVTQG